MYAVIQTGGKQYKVQVGDVLYVEKLSAEADEVVKFETVLAFEDENGIQVGTPTLDIPVEAKVLKNGKAKKITVFTYKPKKNEKRKMGHRQPYTKIEITSINGVANA
ncbi:MAG: 50S ribosomal protein L21 [Clostridia bacterium]|nr:50S ribosomal protein L21 [Clostridia bacterium]